MTAEIIPFPNSNVPDHPTCRIVIHHEIDGVSVVKITPCPPGVIPRRLFPPAFDPRPYADALARKYARVNVNGYDAWSYSTLGPEHES